MRYLFAVALLAASCMAFEAQLSSEAFAAPGPVFAPDMPSATARGDEARKRLDTHRDALQALYRFAVLEANAFRRYAWERKKWFLPDPTDNRFSITLCRDQCAVQKEWERILRESKIRDRGIKVRACCHAAGKRIYLADLDAMTLLHEMGHMLFPDAIMVSGGEEDIADLFSFYIIQRVRTAEPKHHGDGCEGEVKVTLHGNRNRFGGWEVIVEREIPEPQRAFVLARAVDANAGKASPDGKPLPARILPALPAGLQAQIAGCIQIGTRADGVSAWALEFHWPTHDWMQDAIAAGLAKLPAGACAPTREGLPQDLVDVIEQVEDTKAAAVDGVKPTVAVVVKRTIRELSYRSCFVGEVNAAPVTALATA